MHDVAEDVVVIFVTRVLLQECREGDENALSCCNGGFATWDFLRKIKEDDVLQQKHRCKKIREWERVARVNDRMNCDPADLLQSSADGHIARLIHYYLKILCHI